MRRSEDRILTTHVGSLIRPASLLGLGSAPVPTGFAFGSARTDLFTGDDAHLDELSRDVDEVVRQQVGVGLDVVNDGEFGKSSWSAYILERISGFEIHPDRPKPLVWLGRDRERFPGFFAASEMANAVANGSPSEVCVGPIAYRDDAPIHRDLTNLAAAAAKLGSAGSGTELFFTSVAPASTAYQGVNEFYASEEEYVYALADALAVEYRAVHEAGFILQVDDAVLANMYDYLIEQGESVWRRWAQLRIEALNHALSGIPSDRVRYHICFGSWHVPHVADAPLEAILPFMLQVRADAYSIEAANPRHEHEYRLWETAELPEEKLLIPGIVSHHTTTVEHPDLVAMRIERFTDLLGRERVIAGTDCGFAQGSRIRRVHPEVMWAKFDALVRGAEIVSRKLWT